MVKKILTGATFVKVATVATIAAISLHVFGNPWSKPGSTSSSKDTEQKDDKNVINKEESNEVKDSPEDTTGSTAPQSDAEEIASPPSTPNRPKTAKGKKWRDRLSAKKDKKLSKKQYDSVKAE